MAGFMTERISAHQANVVSAMRALSNFHYDWTVRAFELGHHLEHRWVGEKLTTKLGSGDAILESMFKSMPSEEVHQYRKSAEVKLKAANDAVIKRMTDGLNLYKSIAALDYDFWVAFHGILCKLSDEKIMARGLGTDN